MATFTWTSGVSADWSTASDWTPSGGPPNSSTTGALINAVGTYTVTISQAETANAVTLNAAGAELSVASTGTLFLTGSNPELQLDAGTLDLDGTLMGGTVLAAGGTLQIDSSANNATLNGVTWQGPLVLGTNDLLNIAGGLTVETASGGLPGTIDATAGGVSLLVLDSETLNNELVAFGSVGTDSIFNSNSAGGTLTLGSGFTLSQTGGFNSLINQYLGDTITNFGQIDIMGGDLQAFFDALSNSGTVLVSGGGTADFSFITLSNSGLINIGPTGDVVLGAIASNTGSLEFSGADGVLTLDQSGSFQGTISGIAPTDTIVLADLIYGGTTTPQLLTGNHLRIVEGGTTVTLNLNSAQNFSGDRFQLALDPTSGGTSVTMSVACFAAGTRIRTRRGDVVVEDLVEGDVVPMEIDGGEAPIVWIGRSDVDCAHHPRPRTVWPVLISAHAFGPSMPERDLLLSPDHAVYVDEVLIPVGQLANGTSIAQVPVGKVTYYHVELPRHDVLLAEGLPVESYLDTGDRSNFANGGGPMRLFPHFLSAPNAPVVWEARGCAPLIVTGPKLDAVRERVNARAQFLVKRGAVA